MICSETREPELFNVKEKKMKRVIYKGDPYQGGWSNAEEMVGDFSESIEVLKGAKVLYALP